MAERDPGYERIGARRALPTMPRPLDEQVVVLTGASSGIGRETALALGSRGATVVLAARSADGLEDVAAEVERRGGRALPVPTDVAHWHEVRALADSAAAEFGRIDAWVNNAAVGVYARVEDITVEEFRRVVEVDLLGVVHGTKAALPHMRRRRSGVIVNNASTLAERAVPLLSSYCAAKHGVRAFSEALRIELERDGAGIAVVVLEPSSINTPFFEHARSRLGAMPRPIPPVYRPRAVADAVLAVLERPVRTVTVGAAGKGLILAHRMAPRVMDRLMAAGGASFRAQTSRLPDDGRDVLHTPSGVSPSEGPWRAPFGRSPYTQLIEVHPWRKRLLAGAAVAGAALALRRRA